MSQLSPLSVSIHEAVKMTGIGRTSIYAAIKIGALPIRKVGRRTIIETSALKSWLSSLPTSAGTP